MPVTLQQYEKSLSAPALCEQLRIRDLLDNVGIQIDGSFVAGYELGGVHSYYASDEMRNRDKNGLEALARAGRGVRKHGGGECRGGLSAFGHGRAEWRLGRRG